MTGPLLSLLHLCDSLFPIGAFSHSDGLEAATASGRVSTAEQFSSWLVAIRDHALRVYEGPAVSRAWRAARAGDAWRLAMMDEEVFALRPALASREASRAMGSRLLRTWRHLHPAEPPMPFGSDDTLATLPVAFGIVCAGAGITERDAVGGYIYTRLAASLSSAMRLMSLGQHQGHAALAAVLASVPQVIDGAISDQLPLRSFTPALDIAAMRHQYVHSRLFRS